MTHIYVVRYTLTSGEDEECNVAFPTEEAARELYAIQSEYCYDCALEIHRFDLDISAIAAVQIWNQLSDGWGRLERHTSPLCESL